jgi:hypothetical protein
MIMLVLISNLVGVALHEGRQCRRLTHQTITVALLVMTYGNDLGGLAAK